MESSVKWYEAETPERVKQDGMLFEYFPKADRVNIILPNWLDENGKLHTKKPITFKLDHVRRNKELINMLYKAYIKNIER